LKFQTPFLTEVNNISFVLQVSIEIKKKDLLWSDVSTLCEILYEENYFLLQTVSQIWFIEDEVCHYFRSGTSFQDTRAKNHSILYEPGFLFCQTNPFRVLQMLLSCDSFLEV